MFNKMFNDAIYFKSKDEFLNSTINYYPKNLFIKVTSNEIDDLEKITPIPQQLKQFWLEVGEGFINSSNDGQIISDCNNQILSPLDIKNILLGNSDERPFFELENNTIPFFEVTPSSFICMKNTNDNIGIYWMFGNKIANSLQDFINILLLDPNNLDWS